MSSQEVAIGVQGSLREDLVKKAVDFLQNPKLHSSATVLKEEFLRQRGLTNEEIRIAFQRSNTASTSLPFRHDTHLANPMQSSTAHMPWFERFKDVVVVIGASYGLYYFYKSCIAPFLFECSSSPKSTEKSSAINETMENSKKDLEKVLSAQNEQQNLIREISQIKSEIATIKGILLSRHQFPSVSLSTASIPAWQLNSSTHKHVKEILEGEDVEHNSGSSEPETAPNSNRNGGSQGSDSSLEMIKEVDG